MPGNLDLDGFFEKVEKEMDEVRKELNKQCGTDFPPLTSNQALVQKMQKRSQEAAGKVPVSAEEFRAQMRLVAKAQEQERLYRENPLLQELHRLEQLLKLNRESQNTALREAEEQVAKSKAMVRSQWVLIGCLHVAFILAFIIAVAVKCS